jgi:hypothetical protein
MKKILAGIVSVALLSIMVSSVYAIAVPAPYNCPEWPNGFTPGFWKHNIEVRLSHAPYTEALTNGKYSAFGWANANDELDGVKLTDQLMDTLLAGINSRLGTAFTFDQLLANLQLTGNSVDRTNTANQFNYQAGYSWYVP